MPRQSLIQLRRGTAAEWSSANPVLANGEIAFDTTNNDLYIGDGVTQWSSLTPLTGGEGPAPFDLSESYYSFAGYPVDDHSQDTGYAGLDMDSVPTNFLTDAHSWFVAIKMSRVGIRDAGGSCLVDGGIDDAGLGWATDGGYFLRNSNSFSDIMSTDVGTPASCNTWIIIQWDADNTAYDAWVDGNREIDQQTPAWSPTSTQPTQVSFFRTINSPNYAFNMIGAASCILIGNGNKLTNGEAISMEQLHNSYSSVPAAVQAKVTHAWSFSGTAPVTDKGGIDLSVAIDTGTNAAHEFVKDISELQLATIADASVEAVTSGPAVFDLSSVVTNRADRTLTYSKVSGPSWIGEPDSNTGLISSILGTGEAEGEYTAVYKITDASSNEDEMTLTVNLSEPIFEEFFDSGLNGWTVVNDASSLTNADLVLSSMSNSSYDKTYLNTGLLAGQLNWIDGTFISNATYPVYTYDAGGGTYYYAIKENIGSWVVISSTVHPVTVVNGTDLLGSGQEAFTSFSKAEGSLQIPDDADANVSYANGDVTYHNHWHVGTAVSNNGVGSAYITDDGGTSNTYDNTVSSVTHMYKDFTTPADYSGSSNLYFAWRCAGQSVWDYLRIYIAPSGTTPTGGAEVSTAYNVAGGSNRYSDAGGSFTETSEDVSSLVTTASTTYRIILSWVNDGSGGVDPAAAVDDIILY